MCYALDGQVPRMKYQYKIIHDCVDQLPQQPKHQQVWRFRTCRTLIDKLQKQEGRDTFDLFISCQFNQTNTMALT